MTTLNLDGGMKYATSTTNREVESIIDLTEELIADLEKVRREAIDIRRNGMSANQFAVSASHGPMDVDVAQMAELASKVRLVNEMRTVVALSTEDRS